MPPLTPEQAQKLAEQQKKINDELIRTQALTEEIFEENIQITNESGSKTVKAYIYDNSASTTYTIACEDITGAIISNIAKGPIVLEENDSLLLDTTVTTSVSGTISILEINRGLVT